MLQVEAPAMILKLNPSGANRSANSLALFSVFADYILTFFLLLIGAACSPAALGMFGMFGAAKWSGSSRLHA